jgi:hypothetical protein
MERTAEELAAINDPAEPGADAAQQRGGNVGKVERGFTTLAMARAYCAAGQMIVEVQDILNTTLCYMLKEDENGNAVGVVQDLDVPARVPLDSDDGAGGGGVDPAVPKRKKVQK